VELLLSGVTYNRRYWDAPGKYSFVQRAAAAGIATLALDRPGTGSSSRPPANDVSFEAELQAIHKVVSDLRSGQINYSAFGRIILVGHSFGSGLALGEAARYNDVDGVIASGFAHGAGPKLPKFGESLGAASEDPLLSSTHPPTGYLTTIPGSRSDLFFNPQDAPLAVRGWDEVTKSTVTTGELSSLGVAYDPAVTQAIRVPVLLAVGQNDALLCGAPLNCSDAGSLLTSESWFYGPMAQLDTFVLPNSGHSINLHANAPEWFSKAQDWVSQRSL
jgi:pimeloyl-ACP methyl ester carboxylesterase